MQQVTRKGNPSLGLSTCGSLKACVEKSHSIKQRKSETKPKPKKLNYVWAVLQTSSSTAGD